MRALRRRAIGCAAVAATGAVLLAAGSAQAQKPEKVGNGIPTGQMGVQLFNYGGFISNGGGLGASPPAALVVPASCATSTSSDCRWTRLESLFAYLQTKGVTNVELFQHQNIPALGDLAGWQRYRTLLDTYGLHAGGWHGDVSEANWDQRIIAGKILGADYLGSGGFPSPGINSYADTLATAQTLNRMGKKSVEAGIGPIYFHNHQTEFTNKYVDDGVLKSAIDIIMERTDSRYVVAELDVKWSSDALDDASGVQSAAFITKYGTRVQMLHIKDGINIANPFPASAPHVATGTGEIDFRPILTAAVNNVRYYHQEHDQGTLTDAEISLTNLKGIGPAALGTVLGLPPTFNSVPAGTPAANNVTPVTLSNTGDLPLSITNIQIQGTDAADFLVVSQNCTAGGGGGPLAPGGTVPNPPRGRCTVNVGFKPTRTDYTSVARIQVTSGSNAPTEQILLTATSTGDAQVPIGGNVESLLNLSIPTNGGSFGTFVPGIAANYNTALAAHVTTTTADAALTVSDPDAVNPGYLVNGAFKLASPVGIRALGLGDPASTPFTPIGAGSLSLRSWSGPVTNEQLTIGLRQAISNSEPLRAGNYSKTLTFTLSTTTP